MMHVRGLAYRQRNYRLKCGRCRRWMRNREVVRAGEVLRRQSPHANRCVDCPVQGTCSNGCTQCA